MSVRHFFFLAVCLALLGCSAGTPKPPLPTPPNVDLPRFMGAWYVLGFIPLPPERDAVNGIEHYSLDGDGRIVTVYRFRKGSPDGPLKTFRPSASVVPGTGNSEWKMQFLWPFKADYRIAYVDADYSLTIIARQARDYVWLMARQPTIDDNQWQAMLQRIAAMGYSLDDFVRQPQRWPETQPRPAR
ncbi:lipocalin family protein [Litorivivens sp.]|uniref:lipocalin family protein n=1 Tax=Litorivivens sp. TaxID=2020868 RepID=UPI0035656344